MTGAVDIRPGDLRTVWGILGRILPEVSEVWVFGSRAAGAARRASDLDLAIDIGRPVLSAEAAALAEAFDASDLPYTVDVMDLRGIDDRFAASIAASRVPLPALNLDGCAE